MICDDSRFLSPILDLYDSLLTLAWPQACDVCEQSVEKHADGFVCSDCWKAAGIFNGHETLCSKCGAMLNDVPTRVETYCRRCNDDEYDSAIAIGAYQGALLSSVQKLKQTPYVPKTLAALLFKAFRNSNLPDVELIIPVPLSKKRFATRGFNQAELLAGSLAVRTGIILDKTTLIRKLHIEKSRREMDRQSRVESVNGAFEVVSPRLIERKKILLIDDVFTSGATVSNCAKALKRAGAEKVYVLTAARAV